MQCAHGGTLSTHTGSAVHARSGNALNGSSERRAADNMQQAMCSTNRLGNGMQQKLCERQLAADMCGEERAADNVH